LHVAHAEADPIFTVDSLARGVQSDELGHCGTCGTRRHGHLVADVWVAPRGS
jgi:hypothetical protein